MGLHHSKQSPPLPQVENVSLNDMVGSDLIVHNIVSLTRWSTCAHVNAFVCSPFMWVLRWMTLEEKCVLFAFPIHITHILQYLSHKEKFWLLRVYSSSFSAMCLFASYNTHTAYFTFLINPSGDFTKWKTSSKDLVRFNDWLGELPHPHKVITSGNHEVGWTLHDLLHHSVVTPPRAGVH
jgi:hypothetical protein